MRILPALARAVLADNGQEVLFGSSSWRKLCHGHPDSPRVFGRQMWEEHRVWGAVSSLFWAADGVCLIPGFSRLSNRKFSLSPGMDVRTHSKRARPQPWANGKRLLRGGGRGFQAARGSPVFCLSMHPLAEEWDEAWRGHCTLPGW